MGKRSHSFGLNMIRYIRSHEAAVQKQLADNADLADLLALHHTKILWLQHERLVHLLVTILVAIVFMFLYCLVLLMPCNVLLLILLGIVALLLAAYIFHYFRLENSVQHWYNLYDEIWAAQKL